MKIILPKSSLLYILLLFFVVILLSTCSIPQTIADTPSLNTPTQHPIFNDETKDLYLLRSEHYLYLNALENTETVHVYWAFPPDYAHQTPVSLEIHNDTTDALLSYEIINDELEPNKKIHFTLQPLQEEQQVLLHFSCWVLIKNHQYEELPKQADFPRRKTLPCETKTWLQPTKVTQVRNPLIKRKARQLQGLSNDMIRYAHRIAPFIRWHRYPIFVIQYNLGLLGNQDAFTTLLLNGENVGRSHLACALFRTQQIPARVLLVHNDQGFWTQMHYMVEYYVPSYGWVLLDSTFGQTPYEPKRQIINRICYPEDEENTKKDYIFPFMKGEERWIWIDTPAVEPYYVDCREGSKSQMFPEGIINTDEFTAEYAFFHTRFMFTFYQQYLGTNLSMENQQHFQNATQFQTKALQAFSEKQDILLYIDYIQHAINEYQKITE